MIKGIFFFCFLANSVQLMSWAQWNAKWQRVKLMILKHKITTVPGDGSDTERSI